MSRRAIGMSCEGAAPCCRVVGATLYVRSTYALRLLHMLLCSICSADYVAVVVVLVVREVTRAMRPRSTMRRDWSLLIVMRSSMVGAGRPSLVASPTGTTSPTIPPAG